MGDATMTEQYFTQEPKAPHQIISFPFSFRSHDFTFRTDTSVFSRSHVDRGTQLLLEALPLSFEKRVLDLGCGWGVVGCCMKAIWPAADVCLCDINQRAVETAKLNLATNNLCATVIQSDILESVDGSFDLIVTNPPIRAGKAVVYRFFAQSANALTQDGRLLLVIRTKQGADSAQSFLETLFSSVRIINRGSGIKVFSAAYPLSSTS